MKTTCGNFQGFLYWIPNRKDKKVAGTIYFLVRAPRKKANLPKSDARCWSDVLCV